MVTSSCVTVFTTLGPVTNMYDVPRTMNTKSVMAGRVHRAAGARAEDGRDLRHDTGGERVPEEDVGVAT